MILAVGMLSLTSCKKEEQSCKCGKVTEVKEPTGYDTEQTIGVKNNCSGNLQEIWKEPKKVGDIQCEETKW